MHAVLGSSLISLACGTQRPIFNVTPLFFPVTMEKTQAQQQKCHWLFESEDIIHRHCCNLAVNGQRPEFIITCFRSHQPFEAMGKWRECVVGIEHALDISRKTCDVKELDYTRVRSDVCTTVKVHVLGVWVMTLCTLVHADSVQITKRSCLISAREV